MLLEFQIDEAALAVRRSKIFANRVNRPIRYQARDGAYIFKQVVKMSWFIQKLMDARAACIIRSFWPRLSILHQQ